METPRRTLRPMNSTEIASAVSKVKRPKRSTRTKDFEGADTLSKWWWPRRKRSTRLKDFAEAIARHNHALKNPEIPDYIRESLARAQLPKDGRRYKEVTREKAMAYYRRFVDPMPKDWYMHRVKGRWVGPSSLSKAVAWAPAKT
jgi:hypothetical protein